MIQKRGMRGMDRLSPREKQIYKLVLSGTTYKQIGLELGIKPATVAIHYKNAIDKLNPPPFIPLQPNDEPPPE